jgi:curved DNA-binding protein
MDFKDYYAVLGVPPDADEQAIKKAYRKLARQYHPDVNPGDKKAEERFKEINEAYEALSDPERRRKYDHLRDQYQRWQQHGGGEFDWGPWQTAPGQTVYTYTTVSPEDLEDLFGSESPFSDFFGTIFGQPRSAAPRGPQRGRDIELPVEISLEEAFHGTTRSLQTGTRRIEAKIPVGARTGTRVRLAGQGRPGITGGPPGDLYLLITVLPHPQFDRNGDDLTTTVAVDCFTAIAGGEARVPTLDGSVLLKIPPRTQADQVFRLRGKGMPRLERPTERGDLFARVKLVLPEALSDSDVETIRALVRERV